MRVQQALVATAEPSAKAGEYAFNPFDVAPFKEYVAGGLVNPQKEVHNKSYKSLNESLETTTNPQLLLQESMLKGDGIDCHLALSAVLDFQQQQGRWPAIRSDADAHAVVDIAQQISGTLQVRQVQVKQVQVKCAVCTIPPTNKFTCVTFFHFLDGAPWNPNSVWRARLSLLSAPLVYVYRHLIGFWLLLPVADCV